MFEALDHVVLAVRDLDAARRSLSHLLGRAPSWCGVHPNAGTANALFRLDNTYIELLAVAGRGPLGRLLESWLAEHGEGPAALALRTPDAAHCRDALRQRGFDPGPLEAGCGRSGDALREWRRVPLPLTRTRGVPLFAIEHLCPPESLPPAPLSAARDAAVSALDHVVVQTTDAEAARALYGEGLGLRLALDRRFEQWGMRLLFFRIGGLTIEVAATLTQESATTEAPDRLWGLSYRVPNAGTAHARLRDEGIDVSEVRPGRKPGTRVLGVRDAPMGIPTLLLEAAPPPSPG